MTSKLIKKMQQVLSPHSLKTFGARGEDLAARLLEKKGFQIVKRNYRCRLGEIDIIAQKKGEVIFVEVKSRHSMEAVSPLELISQTKKLHLSKVAQYYLTHEVTHDLSASFAVIAIDYSVRPPKCDWVPDAFELSWGY